MRGLGFELRRGRAEDLDGVILLDRATDLAPHWPVAVYQTILGEGSGDAPSGGRCLIVAERVGDDWGLIGFAVGLVHPAPPPGESARRIAELEDVVVAADFRRSGVGRALCSAVLGWCYSQGAEEAILEVRAGNSGAIALYEQLGFRQAGRRPRYYRDPDDDAIAMRLCGMKAAF